MSSDSVFAARQKLIRAALHAIATNDYGQPEDPNGDAAADHADEQLALAARELAEVVEMLPRDEQPVGWSLQVWNADDGTHGVIDFTLGQWLARCEQHGDLARESNTDAGYRRAVAVWKGHELQLHQAANGGDQ